MKRSSINTRKCIGAVALCAAVGLLAIPTLTSAQEGKNNDEVFNETRAVPIPGMPLVSFDISWFEGSLNRYYLGDRSNKAVDVIDPPSTVTQFQPTAGTGLPPTVGGFIGFTGNNNTSGPDGVMVIPNNGSITGNSNQQLWVGDGKSRVWVLDATTGTVLTLPGSVPNPIPTSSNNPNRADELCFDAADGLVMVANNADDPPFASIISTKTYTVVGKIVFDGTNGAPKSTNGAEQCQWSPRTGLFYINVPGVHVPDDGTGATVAIDPKIGTAPNVGKVVGVFVIPLADCAAPQGMALGPDKQIFLGCNGASPSGHFNTVVINENSGAVIRTLVDEGGNDEVWYNPGDGHYLGGGGQTAPVERLIIVDSAGKRPDQSQTTGFNCNTTRRAHSVAADPNTNEVYVPIPATTGTPPNPLACPSSASTPFFTSSLCTNPTLGCVAVFGPVGKNDKGKPIVRNNDND
jgi:hypothetical protein